MLKQHICVIQGRVYDICLMYASEIYSYTAVSIILMNKGGTTILDYSSLTGILSGAFFIEIFNKCIKNIFKVLIGFLISVISYEEWLKIIAGGLIYESIKGLQKNSKYC
mgnify:FL=1